MNNEHKQVDFLFFVSEPNLDVGSYRIWVSDLQHYLKQIGCNVAEVRKLQEIRNYKFSALIIGKEDAAIVHAIRSLSSGLIGIINPERKYAKSADFVIVGSVEERLSLMAAGPAFMFPLIERMYTDVGTKIHDNVGPLTIAYHGNSIHLQRLKFGLGPALAKFSKEEDIVFRVIASNIKSVPKTIFPNGVTIELMEWNRESIVSEILNSDIGVVIGVSNQRGLGFNSKKLGYYKSDYHLRFKNKSNSGRVFPFIQLGVPVIADITPSNFHLFAGLNGGELAFDEAGWLYALRKYSSASNRSQAAKENLEIFKREYDPLLWARHLCAEVMQLKNERN